jgi:P63C domain
VYERVAPGVLAELRNKNPVLPQGYRKDRHHRWFTPELGHPRLKEHLSSVMALMRASSGWPQFMRNMNRSLPRLNATIEMPFDD